MFYGNNQTGQYNSVSFHYFCFQNKVVRSCGQYCTKAVHHKTKVLHSKMMKRWRNYHDDSGMLGKAEYHVSLFPLYRNSFLKCTDALCFLLVLFPSIANRYVE